LHDYPENKFQSIQSLTSLWNCKWRLIFKLDFSLI